MVSVHSGNNAAVYAGTAGTKQYNRRHQQSPVFRFTAREQAAQPHATLLNPLSQAQRKSDDRAGDHSQHNRRHILHQYNAADADCHGTYAEDQVQFLPEILCHPSGQGRPQQAAQGDRKRVDHHSDRHPVILPPFLSGLIIPDDHWGNKPLLSRFIPFPATITENNGLVIRDVPVNIITEE